ncbi:related to DUF255 domain protein [Cephalotrichum gorgonifer]|uniref:Related to DUF255 domain protein n=1 Tax=Cephalotrichum gorgonifer TaxID=2041049 RepID=A0AAE8MTJ6_9PEZI|nr:related to DUF255 domain protein [Cephalotrichum gorgonifer]
MDPTLSSDHLKNRVASSKSPYVSSQAGSPVAWQLLDEEAVSRARAENKMIFLNIGYNSCHYCRLMMTEALSHPQCAKLLNSHFIPILVDREERPDVDTIYMNYVQAVNGAGGWPLNLFLTPDLAPVFGGTYWPGASPGADAGNAETEDEEGMDFLNILKKLKSVWQEQETRCRTEAADVLNQLREFAAEGTMGRGVDRRASFPAATVPSSAAIGMQHSKGLVGSASPRSVETSELDLDQLEEAYTHIAGTFDPIDGGFGIAPKFPTPAKLSFLLKLSHLPREVQHVVGEVECATAHEMTLFTLRKMRDGGLRDHVGGQGLSRYSVTSDWSVPHFEKLTVDNALLLSVYLDAWLSGGASESDEFFDIIVELADYLASPPVRLPGGGLASSEAADSYYAAGDTHLHDGAYQLWTRREFDSVLGDGQASAIAAAHWNVLQHGNVEPEFDPSDEFMNRNVLRVMKDASDLSRQFRVPVEEVKAVLKDAREKLRAHREKVRVRPALDDKVVTGWNGLGIVALARVAMGLKHIEGVDHGRYLDAAVGVANFLKRELWVESEKRLYRLWRGERGDTKAFAEDYAYLIEGLLELYQATLDEGWLKWADELQEIQIDLFYDPVVATPESAEPSDVRSSSGGFYSTEASSPHTILRLKDGMDTSLPSTNAASAWNLFRLGAMLDDSRYTTLAKETVAAFEAEILQYPWLFPGLLAGVVASRLGGRNWLVVGGEKDVSAGNEKAKVIDKEKGKEENVNGKKKAGLSGGTVGLNEFFKALDMAPRGELRALVSVEGRQEWVAERRGKEQVKKVEGEGGIFCCEGEGLRRFTKHDLGDFTGQM